MSEAFTYKPYTSEQAEAVLDLWRASELGSDFPLSRSLWEANTVYEVNFAPDDFLGAWNDNGQLVGLVLSRRFRDKSYPRLAQGYADTGWISVLLVHPDYRGQGLGSYLLNWAEGKLTDLRQIRLGGDAGHFFPGLPDPLPTDFFSKRGYTVEPTVETDLLLDLTNWQAPPVPPLVQSGQYYYTQGQPDDQKALLEFIQQPDNHFSPRWYYKRQQYFEKNFGADTVTLLKQADGTIAGFLQTWLTEQMPPSVGCPLLTWASGVYPDRKCGSIGPLGVASTVRGGGLGLGLVAAATRHLQAHGVTIATIDWTTLTDFYGKLGYQPWRTYHYAYKVKS